MLSFILALGLASARDTTKITVYHVNPQHLGAVPINMDTGDVVGDMYFDMSDVILQPLACPNGAASGHGCSNPEAVSPDLMVNKVTLELIPDYSGYAMCNIGLPNGKDIFGDPCKNNTYCCICTVPGTFHDVIPCNYTAGRANVREKFSPSAIGNWTGCVANSTHPPPAYECYRTKLTDKFTEENPGYWYSTLKEGYCPDGRFSRNCTWRGTVEKVIQRSCHNKVFFGVIEAYNPPCFAGCGADSRNSSSACWTDCFYKTVLGPNAGSPGGKVSGMPLDEMIAAWSKPFAAPKDGGCPAAA